MELVRGMNRRVVVIKSPDRNLFEEAIFIVREDAFHRGVTGEDILREAQRVASEYASGRAGRARLTRLSVPVRLMLGAIAVAAVCGAIWFFM